MDRASFGKTLDAIVIPDGTPAEDINRMVSPIREAIVEMMPHRLYRYRPCDEKRIDAFDKDAIFAVPADWFNDPYDTLVRYDLISIKQYVETIMSIDWLEQLKDLYAQGHDIPVEYKQILPEGFWKELRTKVLGTKSFEGIKDRMEDTKQLFLSLVSTYFPILSFYAKRFSTIACFSEDIKSILMWSHYADSHRGFALEYDFRPSLTNPIPNMGVYPVIYSDERYDASAYIAWAFFTVMGIKAINPDISASLKAALHKSNIWEYEKSGG